MHPSGVRFDNSPSRPQRGWEWLSSFNMNGPNTDRVFIAAPSFTVLFSVVGLALYGLPFYYDYMVSAFGWSRTQVTSGNALSKLVVGPLFGFFAGWIVDRFGPRRLMLAGIMMAGVALIG